MNGRLNPKGGIGFQPVLNFNHRLEAYATQGLLDRELAVPNQQFHIFCGAIEVNRNLIHQVGRCIVV